MNKLIPKEYLKTNATGQAKALIIKTDEDNLCAQSLGTVYKNIIKEAKAYFGPKKKKAKSVHTDWVEAEREAIEPYEKAVSILKSAMLKYEEEQEKIRREKEAKLRAAEEARRAKEIEQAEEKGVEPPELDFTSEDIVVPAMQRQGQTRTTQELVVTDLDAFIVWLGKSPYPAADYITVNKTACKSLAKLGAPGIKLQEKKIKVF